MDTFLKSIKEYAEKNKIPIIMDSTAQLLEILILAVKPRIVLEIGTGIGYSAILIAGFLPKDGRIDTIEIDPERVEKAWENINKAGVNSIVRILEGDAKDILPVLNQEYDLIFLDAAKSKYIELLPECIRLLKKSGLLIADNVLYKGMTKGPEWVRHKQRTAVNRLRDFLEAVEEHPQLKTLLLPVGDGITISVKL